MAGALVARSAASQDAVSSATLVKHLAGTWSVPEERTPRSTPLDEQVFGRGAVDVRNVSLVVLPSGDATLQVKTSVVAKARTFSPSLLEVKMHIGEPVTSGRDRIEPTVTVTSADERYLDTHDRWPLEGAHVSLLLISATSREINLQFDTRNGQGAFGATLTRRP